MRCSLNRETLLEALGTVVNVLPSKATSPIYQNILLEINKGRLAITGTDGDNVVRREVKLEGKSEDGGALLDGRRLTELIRCASSVKNITLATRETMVVIEADRIKANFTQLAPEQFPELPKLPSDIQFEFPLATLFDMFDTCSFAVSRDDLRPVMTAINWEVGKTESRMVATDSIRLAFVSRKVKSPTKAKLLLMPKAVDILPRGEDKVQVFSDQEQKILGFKLENTTVISRMIEGPYPEYERVIPKNLSSRAIVTRELLVNVLQRALIFANPINKLVRFEFSAQNMIVRAETPEFGKSEEELDCQFQGENLTVGFNGSFLMDILNHIKTSELAIEISSPMSPVVFKPMGEAEDGEDLFIMMPVRLD